MLVDYVQCELVDGSCIVVEIEYWLVVVFYWAVWLFEMLLLFKVYVLWIIDLIDVQCSDLVLVLKKLISCYDNFFQCFFFYFMGWYGVLFNGEEN